MSQSRIRLEIIQAGSGCSFLLLHGFAALLLYCFLLEKNIKRQEKPYNHKTIAQRNHFYEK